MWLMQPRGFKPKLPKFKDSWPNHQAAGICLLRKPSKFFYIYM
jgi:hypothetical protein